MYKTEVARCDCPESRRSQYHLASLSTEVKQLREELSMYYYRARFEFLTRLYKHHTIGPDQNVPTWLNPHRYDECDTHHYQRECLALESIIFDRPAPYAPPPINNQRPHILTINPVVETKPVVEKHKPGMRYSQGIIFNNPSIVTNPHPCAYKDTFENGLSLGLDNLEIEEDPPRLI